MIGKCGAEHNLTPGPWHPPGISVPPPPSIAALLGRRSAAPPTQSTERDSTRPVAAVSEPSRRPDGGASGLPLPPEPTPRGVAGRDQEAQAWQRLCGMPVGVLVGPLA